MFEDSKTIRILEVMLICGDYLKDRNIIEVLLQAGGKARNQWLECIDSELFCNQEMCDLIYDSSCQPQPLQQICRLFLRSLAKQQRGDDFVDCLPLPDQLKDYIVMRAELRSLLQNTVDISMC